MGHSCDSIFRARSIARISSAIRGRHRDEKTVQRFICFRRACPLCTSVLPSALHSQTEGFQSKSRISGIFFYFPQKLINLWCVFSSRRRPRMALEMRAIERARKIESQLCPHFFPAPNRSKTIYDPKPLGMDFFLAERLF